MKMTDYELAAIVLRELQQARGYDSDVLSSKRAGALALYNGAASPAPEGRSQIVSLDVADALHATLAQVSPVVRSSQIEFEAMSQDDEQQAQTESDFVRVTIERAGGYDTVDQCMHDALLIGNGWLHCYVDTRKDVTEQRFPPGLSETEQYVLTSQAPPNVTVTLREGKEYTLAKITTERKSLKIECVPPEDMLFSEQGSDYNLDELRFVARRRLYTAAQLKAKGVSNAKIEQLQDAYPDEQGERAGRHVCR